MARLLRCSRLPQHPSIPIANVNIASRRTFPPLLPTHTRRAGSLLRLPICAALAQQELRQRAAAYGTSKSASKAPPTPPPSKQLPAKPAESSTAQSGGRGGGRGGGGRGGRGRGSGGRGGRGNADRRGSERSEGADEASAERAPREEARPSQGQQLIEAAALELGALT